jgi:hypothetical protein
MVVCQPKYPLRQPAVFRQLAMAEPSLLRENTGVFPADFFAAQMQKAKRQADERLKNCQSF